MRPTRLLVLLAGSLLPAQQIVWERVGVKEVYSFGSTRVAAGLMDVLGDVNGDGYDDLIYLGADMTVQGEASLVWILSGKDGRTLHEYKQQRMGFPHIGVAAAGDMDGDRVLDYATTIRDNSGWKPNRIEVRSTRDDRLLWKVERPWRENFGPALLGRIDVNGDGRPDLVATATRLTRNGGVYAFSHQGKLLWRVPGTRQMPVGMHGSSSTLANAGDVDGDGAQDVVVGAVDGKTARFGAGCSPAGPASRSTPGSAVGTAGTGSASPAGVWTSTATGSPT